MDDVPSVTDPATAPAADRPPLPPTGAAGSTSTSTVGEDERRDDQGGGTNLRSATVWMAAGTGVSRFTGVLRVLALAYALGATPLADSYNLANTSPNMLYDIVLGGILSATFIPVFVDRLTTRSEKEAWRAISAVITLSAVVLVVATVIFWFAAPVVISAFTALDHAHGAVASTSLDQERATATSLLRWFVPQVAIYGFISLATALLNTRRRFIAPMWVPIANNLVCIAVLLWFHHLVPSPAKVGVHLLPSQIVLLGLGTTLGVAVQAVCLIPSLRHARLGGLRWHWAPGHEAVHTILRLGTWTFGFVMANQLALFVVLALAVGAGGPAPVSSYTYAYTFLQMPYAVVAVSVMSAVTPDLAQQWTAQDLPAFRRRLSTGLRAVLAIIIPSSVGMLLLARPAVALLIDHGAFSSTGSNTTGATLALFSLGLPGFCTFLYVVRVLQSMQRARVAFWLYLVENGLNVALAVLLVHPLGVRGLALSLSIAYSVAAVVGIVVLRRWLGPLGTRRLWSPLRRVAIASVVMGVAVLVVSNLSGATHGVGLLLRVVGAVIIGAAVYVGMTALLARRSSRRGPDEPEADRAGSRRPVAYSGPAASGPAPYRPVSLLPPVAPALGELGDPDEAPILRISSRPPPRVEPRPAGSSAAGSSAAGPGHVGAPDVGPRHAGPRAPVAPLDPPAPEPPAPMPPVPLPVDRAASSGGRPAPSSAPARPVRAPEPDRPAGREVDGPPPRPPVVDGPEATGSGLADRLRARFGGTGAHRTGTTRLVARSGPSPEPPRDPAPPPPPSDERSGPPDEA